MSKAGKTGAGDNREWGRGGKDRERQRDRDKERWMDPDKAEEVGLLGPLRTRAVWKARSYGEQNLVPGPTPQGPPATAGDSPFVSQALPWRTLVQNQPH